MVRQGGERAVDLSQIDAVIFDMDGVMTDTAEVHAAAWKEMFDAFLQERSGRLNELFVAFDPEDYLRYVDGKPRYDGVRSFLQSRGIDLPEGGPADSPTQESVHGLGNRKDELFLERLHRSGARRFDSSVAFVEELGRRGVGCAIISASRNMSDVLASAGIEDLFTIRVDGVDAERLGLAGKPDPAIFIEAARRLGVAPRRAAVVEDALAGVEAGRRGGFGMVIGIDRSGHPQALREHGADVVVGDLAELRIERTASVRSNQQRVRDLPSALDPSWAGVHLGGRTPAVFLDYDGTLTPIVQRPEDAVLEERSRDALRSLADRWPVAIISGRDLGDVKSMVGLPNIVYAGSHGFDIETPDGRTEQRGTEFLPDLDAAERELDGPLMVVPGARVERKRFAVAVHYRQVAEDRVPEVERVVSSVAATHPRLRRTGGKKVFELRPRIEWDKGRALLFLLKVLGLNGSDVVPIYIGDDETDEDAFAVLRGRGFGIVVARADDERPTAADARLTDPDEVRRLLELLTDTSPAS
jgi:alpha,alpha-trehalase